MPATNPIRKPRSVTKTAAGPRPKNKCPSAFAFPESAIVTVTERNFLQQHTPQAVLDMIKAGTYDSALTAFLRIEDPLPEDGLVVLRSLFAKRLTQSDVGQRKGLVVPKRDAEECFPDVRNRDEESVTLRFLERRTRRWLDLRYCFYQSSQNYVLTTGWCKYVKANRLKEKDVVTFYECARKDGGERYVMIDTERAAEEKKRTVETVRKSAKRVREEVMVARKRRYSGDASRERSGVIDIGEVDADVHRGVRLFGVIIG